MSLRALLVGLLILLPACSPADSGRNREVRVTLTEFSVQLSTRTFTAGVPYHLLIINQGQVNHELRIVPPGVHGGPGEIASVDQMILQPGATHTIDVIFPEAARGTDLEFACHLPAHYEFGMHAAVVVR
jgi:uncharacterized cupredoxin-like copper-binding protein